MKKNTTCKFLIGSWVSFYPFEIDSYEFVSTDKPKDLKMTREGIEIIHYYVFCTVHSYNV